MRHFFIIIFCYCFFYQSKAQDTAKNLVINPDMEMMVDCPRDFGDIWKVKNWYGSPYTTDFFSTCSYNAEFRSPNQTPGEAMPNSGINMAGIILSLHGSKYYDYLIGSLKTPLEKGKTYCFSLQLRLASNSPYSSDWLSVFFTDTHTLIKRNNQMHFPFHPWEYNTLIPEKQPVRSTENWVRLKLSYTARGGEKNFWIGGGGGSREPSYILTSDTFARTFIKEKPKYEFIDPEYTVYYFVDDVYMFADSGNNKLTITSYPDCANPYFTFAVPADAEQVKWFDGSTGRQLKLALQDVPDTVFADYNTTFTCNMHRNYLPMQSIRNHSATELKVFPNPAGEYISCRFSATESMANGSIHIYDVTGKKVQTFDVPVAQGWNEQNLHIGGISRGVYVLEVPFSDCVKRYKFYKSE